MWKTLSPIFFLKAISSGSICSIKLDTCTHVMCSIKYVLLFGNKYKSRQREGILTKCIFQGQQ